MDCTGSDVPRGGVTLYALRYGPHLVPAQDRKYTQPSPVQRASWIVTSPDLGTYLEGRRVWDGGMAMVAQPPDLLDM